MKIQIMQNLLEANNQKAEEVRNLLNEKNIKMFNLISSPGSGKTTLLEKTLPILNKIMKVAVIEGDVQTARDAERLDHYDVPIVLVNTNGACHLKSVSIEKALTALDLENLDLILIENIGNLVCPSGFDIGEHAKIAMVSVAEGDDKPIKYPRLFKEADLVILNKLDLLEFSDFNKSLFYQDIKTLNPNLSVIEVSCKRDEGIQNWIDWLGKRCK